MHASAGILGHEALEALVADVRRAARALTARALDTLVGDLGSTIASISPRDWQPECGEAGLQARQSRARSSLTGERLRDPHGWRHLDLACWLAGRAAERSSRCPARTSRTTRTMKTPTPGPAATS